MDCVHILNRMSNKGYEKITTGDDDDDAKSPHPTTSANFLSLLSFWWMNSVFKTGSKRPLKQSDFLPLHEKDRTRDLTERLQKEWNNHVQECNMTEGKQPKLWKCVVKTVSFCDICLPMCFWLLESMFRVSQPLVLGFLLYLLDSAETSRPLAYACCVFLTLSGLSSACTHYSAYSCDLLGMRLSSAIKGIVYLKVRNDKYDWTTLFIYSNCYCDLAQALVPGPNLVPRKTYFPALPERMRRSRSGMAGK